MLFVLEEKIYSQIVILINYVPPTYINIIISLAMPNYLLIDCNSYRCSGNLIRFNSRLNRVNGNFFIGWEALYGYQ